MYIFNTSDIVYYLILVLALIFSLKSTEMNFRGLKLLRVLLIGALSTELMVEFLDYYTDYSNTLYYLYLPFEFVTLSLFFKVSATKSIVKRLITYIIPIYLLFAIYFSFFYYSFDGYPGIIYNIGCIFIIIWVVLILFNLEVEKDLKLTQKPLFWICTGCIVFYSGVFFYNAVYDYLLTEKTELAKNLRKIVNLNLNYTLYLIWSYAFLCSIRLKKYFTQ